MESVKDDDVKNISDDNIDTNKLPEDDVKINKIYFKKKCNI